MSSTDIESWVDWYCSLRGNEFFCAVDWNYMTQNFNLTDLSDMVPHYKEALDIITDRDDADEESCEDVKASTIKLYGLIHARYILTDAGIDQMLVKYNSGDFGKCPRVYCKDQALLPIGLTDEPDQKPVKMYCPKCVDVFTPQSSRHHSIDGAYFGTGFPHMLFMVHPELRPEPLTEEFDTARFGL